MERADVFLSELFGKALKQIVGKDVPVSFLPPSNPSYGDYASNVALVVFGKEKGFQTKPLVASSVALAQLLVQTSKHIATDQEKRIIESISVVPPGFINVTLTNEYFVKRLQQLLSPNWTGNTQHFAGKKVMIEFTDPNPFKEFHIGHLYSNIVGESLARLYEANGAIVKRANYQGDVGMHVAKSLYGMEVLFAQEHLTLSALEEKSLPEKASFLGRAYAKGVRLFGDDPKAQEAIKLLNKKIYEHDPSVEPLYEKGRSWSLAYFEELYKRLGTRFDYYYFESQVGESGKALVEEYLTKGVFERSDGAIIFPGERHGLHSRVFVNSLGLPTYEAKELGLAGVKYKDFAYDHSIVITGNEIIGYFKVLLCALSLIRPDLAKKTRHIAHGMVRLPQGKMSSRTGNVITADWLLDKAKEAAKAIIEQGRVVKEKKGSIDGLSEVVGLGAVKYGLLKSSIGGNIVFDFKESVSFEGNAGPYLQYTFARTQSLLRKADEVPPNVHADALNDEERTLLVLLARYEEVIKAASLAYAPNSLCEYLFDLAQAFNVFYQKHSVLGGSSARSLRLALTAGVGKILRQGLFVLGIPAPETM